MNVRLKDFLLMDNEAKGLIPPMLHVEWLVI